MRRFVLLILVGLSVMTLARSSWAQANADDDVEALYENYDKTEQQKTEKHQAAHKSKQPPDKIKTLSDLVQLAPFSDVAVIERKFLPKTHRFELSAAALTSLNNAFFTNVGATARAAFHFSEKYSLEASYMVLTDVQRDITRSLKDKVGISPESLVVPKAYYGLDFRWMPIYGKMAYMNKAIVPYDLFFAIGAGYTKTQTADSDVTIHLGLGQIFAHSKSMAFRWDLGWNMYQAKVEQGAEGTDSVTSNHSDVFLSLGISFYVPEATYR